MSEAATDRPRTVPDLVASASRACPEATAVIYTDHAGTEHTVRFGELDRRARSVAAGLAGLGVVPGDRVALWMPSVPASLCLMIACAQLGAIAVAVNTRYRAGEVEDIVGRTRSKVLAYWPGFRGIDFNAILAGVSPDALEHLEHVVVYDEGEDTGPVPLEGKPHVAYRALEGKPPAGASAVTPGTPFKIFTTSGTTRAPKFVVHTHASVVDHAHDVAAGFGLHAPDTVGAVALPLGGVFGFNGAFSLLAARRPMVLMPVFKPDSFLEQLVRHRVTQWNGADDMVHGLLEAGPPREVLERITHVGFATFNVALSDIVERAGRQGLRLVSLWGMSEMQALVARREPTAGAAERGRMGGHLVSPRGRVRARDPDSGKLLPPGEPGEIEITGPSRMLGYFENDAATAETVTDDGFVRTGDLGIAESERSFEFLARMGDVMRLGGFLVSPAEIEEEIKSVPGVANVQVVAAATDAGHRCVAFVIPDRGGRVDEDEVRGHCAERLARYKVPARVVPVEEFPVTLSANGTKIQRARLREMAEELLRSRAAS